MNASANNENEFKIILEEIEVASRWVRERKGRIAAVVAEYNRRLPRKSVPLTRQQISEWIDLNQKRRVEPRLSSGLRLIAAFRAVRLAEEPEPKAA